MIEPATTISTIPAVLDEDGWNLEFDATDIKISSKYGVCGSDIIGFKTVTEHPVSAKSAFDLLKDVNRAMELVNDQFVLGEVLENWPVDFDEDGTLVRTSFKMPWPFTDREFPHGLHSKQVNETTYVIGYTPIERDDIPVQVGYVRCPMYISGQRITAVNDSVCRVEHLMVYELGGSVSKSFQDKVMKAGHVGAYKGEWRKLRDVLFPEKIENIKNNSLTGLMNCALDESNHWKTVKKSKTGTVKAGRLAFCPKTVYRTDIVVNASIDKVVDVIADKSLEFLPKWNKEFIRGEIVETISDSKQLSEWLVHVQYATPSPISNREYIYYFSREWISDEEAIILYCSVKSNKSVPNGFERALLYPTVHRCIAQNDKTKLEHILATDLKGKLGKYQDSLLKGGLVDAHIRDMNSQEKLFNGLI